MMQHVVTTLRNKVREALEAAMPGLGWTKRTWSRSDQDALARGFVLTPRVLVERHDFDDVRRDVTFQIVVKRKGGDDINDDLDSDAATVEVAVLQVLDQLAIDYGLVEMAAEIDGGANEPFGELNMIFQASVLTKFGDPRVPLRHTY